MIQNLSRPILKDTKQKMELALCIGVGFVNYYLPSAYMDEEFHERQTTAYYNFDYDYWDPKLTTFPGMYFLSSTLRLLFYVSGISVPIQQYRVFNVVYSILLYWMLRRLVGIRTTLLI
jgi:hypothetical protein